MKGWIRFETQDARTDGKPSLCLLRAEDVSHVEGPEDSPCIYTRGSRAFSSKTTLSELMRLMEEACLWDYPSCVTSVVPASPDIPVIT